MSVKKKPKHRRADPEHKADVVSDLLELAQRLDLPSGSLDEEVEDECRAGAKILAQNINGGSLMGQLEFLWEHGYGKNRLAQLIREYGAEKK
jgi:hypothetical protein